MGDAYRSLPETFATMEDAHLVLGHLAEAPERTDTADGRPATVVHAHGRLARMIGEDAETLRGEQTRQIAEQVLARQINLIRRGIDQVCASRPEAPTKVFVTGRGRVLAREALRRSRAAACESVDLEAKLGRNIARAFRPSLWLAWPRGSGLPRPRRNLNRSTSCFSKTQPLARPIRLPSPNCGTPLE
ncbi:MAG: hypothetical protein R3B96_17160 [Pirellulaceae bacterium]